MIKLNIIAEVLASGGQLKGLIGKEKLDKPQAPGREKTIIELWILFIGIWGWSDVDFKQPVNLVENSKELSWVKS